MSLNTLDHEYFMSQFMHLDGETPATLQAVVAAVLHLRTLSEPQLLELASEGRLDEVFPFGPKPQELAPDFVQEEDLHSASALPRSDQERQEHIESSLPKDAKHPFAERVRLVATRVLHSRKSVKSSEE